MEFSVSAQTSEPSKKTVLKLLVDTRRFQMAAAETAKSLALTTILVCRTNSFMVLADHRCRRLAALDKTRPRTSFSVFVAELTRSNF